MDQAEWLTSGDVAKMLDWLGGGNPLRAECPVPPPSDRKLRLFAVGCVRQVWDLITDDAPCSRCGGSGTVLTGSFVGFPGVDDIGMCPDCHGSGRVNRSRRAVLVAERFADGEVTRPELNEAHVQADEAQYASWLAAGLGDPSMRTDAGLAAWSPSLWAEVASRDDLARIPDPTLALSVPPATQGDLLRCVVGNPWRPVALPKCKRCEGDGKAHGSDRPFEWTPEVGYPGPCPVCKGLKSDSPWLAWREGTVARIAKHIYQERAWDETPILAEALEEAMEAGGQGADEECPKCEGVGCPYCGGPDADYHTSCDSCGTCGGTGRIPNPLLAHLRSGGPHCRGCAAVDLILGKE